MAQKAQIVWLQFITIDMAEGANFVGDIDGKIAVISTGVDNNITFFQMIVFEVAVVFALAEAF